MLVTWEVLHDKFGKDEIPEITEKKRKEKLYGINNGNVAFELGFKKNKKKRINGTYIYELTELLRVSRVLIFVP